MPYTMDNPPTWIKNQSQGVQRTCIAAFNAVVRDGGDEDQARQACWNNVRLKYKKVGDKWVPKESEMDYAIDGEGAVCDETPWGQIDKSKLPKSSFAYTPTDKKSDWKLPYKTADGKIHCGGVRAALQAIGGARTGKPMSVPASVKATIRRAAKSCGIGEVTMEQLTEILFSPLELKEQDEQGYYHAKLLCTRGDYVNGNGRVYPMAVWEREIPRVKDLITQGRFIGLADHPSGFFGSGASILNTVIKFDDLRIEGREVWGDVTVIPTSKGKDVIEIAKAGVQIGASTRGRGSLTRPEDGYTDPDGVVHQDVGIVDVDSYKFDAVDLVLQPSVEDAGMYRFEQLSDDDIEQLQGVLFAEIEERATEPLKTKVSELEELLEAAGEETVVKEVEMEKLRDQLSVAQVLVEEKNQELEVLHTNHDKLEASLNESNSQLRASQDRNAALTHLLDRVRGEKFSALLIEELKGCTTRDEVDEKYDAAMTTVMSLVVGSPAPSGKAIVFPQRTDLDSESEERQYEKEHGLDSPLTEEEKAQAARNKKIRVHAGLDMFEE